VKKAATLLAVLLLVAVHRPLVLRLGIAVANHRSEAREVKAGFRPEFDVPSGWSPVIRTDMDDAWKHDGAAGLNYFVIGDYVAPLADAPAQLDPGARRYQAWFGVYVVDLDPEKTDLEHLGPRIKGFLESDQRRWLKTMGDPDPQAEVVHAKQTGTLAVLGQDAPLFEGDVATHSTLSVASTTMAKVLGMPPEARWRGDLSPFHPMALEGFATAHVDREHHALLVIYGAGAGFRRGERDVHTYPALRDELLGMARSVRLRSR